MTKYIIGEIFSSGGATLYKDPPDQTVCNRWCGTLGILSTITEKKCIEGKHNEHFFLLFIEERTPNGKNWKGSDKKELEQLITGRVILSRQEFFVQIDIEIVIFYI